MSRYDDIKIPNNLKEVRNNAIAKADKDRKIKNKRKNLIAASICTVMLGTISVGVFNPSLAYNIPIVGNMLQMIDGALNNNDDLSDSYTIVNKSCSSEGLTVTVEKAVYSKNQIFMELELKTDIPFKESIYAKTITYDPREEFADDLELKGKDWTFSINDKEIGDYGFNSPRFHYIDDYTLKGTMLMDFKSPVKKNNEYDTFKMKFNLEAIDYNKETNESKHIEDINGPWILEFPVKSNSSKTKTIKPKVTKDGITVDEVALTQTSLNLKISSKENMALYADVKDDNGNILSGAGVGISNVGDYDGDYHLNTINQDMEYITVLAYKENQNGTQELISEIKINIK